MRADGTPTPVLASVVDDIDYGTTHIIRGEDNAGNTAVQIELLEVLRGPHKPVRFAHLPALTDSGPGGRKAATLALRNLRSDGVEPYAIAASMTGIASRTRRRCDDLARQFELGASAHPRASTSPRCWR